MSRPLNDPPRVTLCSHLWSANREAPPLGRGGLPRLFQDVGSVNGELAHSRERSRLSPRVPRRFPQLCLLVRRPFAHRCKIDCLLPQARRSQGRTWMDLAFKRDTSYAGSKTRQLKLRSGGARRSGDPPRQSRTYHWHSLILGEMPM